MNERGLKPPGGDPAPTSVVLDQGERLDLVTLASEICQRYRQEFPDEERRYGDAGNAWCVHDNQYLLYWAAEAVNGVLEMTDEVAWLAGVLEARSFPLDRLARGLDIGADVVSQVADTHASRQLVDVLLASAVFVRSRNSFLDSSWP